MDSSVDLRWLALLDQLYERVECDGARALSGPAAQWPANWQPLVRHWAARIGARSIQIEVRRALQSPGREPGLVSRRSITARPPEASGGGPVLTAHSLSPLGFTAQQVREFNALCRHLHSAIALQASLDAQRDSLASLQELVDALPMGLVVLDERREPVLRNRRSCEARPAALREIAVPPAVLVQPMQQRFALTAKEMPLAWNLAQGMPLKQYAALSGRSIETVRAQLKSVLRKLGVADQKGIGLVLFEALHVVTLQVMGEGLVPLAAGRAGPQGALPWR